MNPYAVFTGAIALAVAAALALPHALKQPAWRVEEWLLLALFPVFCWVWWALRPNPESPAGKAPEPPGT